MVVTALKARASVNGAPDNARSRALTLAQFPLVDSTSLVRTVLLLTYWTTVTLLFLAWQTGSRIQDRRLGCLRLLGGRKSQTLNVRRQGA